MTDLHTKVFQSQRLTADFLKKHGFELIMSHKEDEFSWDEFVNSNFPMITVFFNYYNNGKTTYDVEFESWELHNVDKSRFLTLLQMLKPKEDA